MRFLEMVIQNDKSTKKSIQLESVELESINLNSQTTTVNGQLHIDVQILHS